ncbi:MAG: hypothetical protein L0K27_08155 [Corynebacterium nuruki]|nr:hypothetical protein [Corynebacterium nuruki]
MELSAGRVTVFEPTVAPAPDSLPDGHVASFDQSRHAAAGTRPGSWLAVAFRLPPVGLGRVGQAWRRVIDRHGTLRTVLRDDGPDPVTGQPLIRTHDIVVTGGVWRSHGDPGADPATDTAIDTDPRTLLRDYFDEACEPFGLPSYRLAVVDHGGGHRTAVIGLDHCHGDAWSLLVLVRDMLAFLGTGEDGVVDGASDRAAGRPADHTPPGLRATVPSFAEHTRGLEVRPPAPAEVRNRWAEIMAAGGGRMPVFPLDLGDVSVPRDEVVEVVDVLDPTGVARLEAVAADSGVRLLPMAVSVLVQVNRDMGAGALRAVFPVHSRRGPDGDRQRWADSVGWFITNAVLEADSTDPVVCSGAVGDAIALGSHPLEPLLRPWGGMPQSPGMFAVSWLDNRRLPVQVPAAARPQHVSARIMTDGVMAWFVVDDDGLQLRVRYPSTPQARTAVGQWSRRVTAGLRAAAAGSPDASGRREHGTVTVA